MNVPDDIAKRVVDHYADLEASRQYYYQVIDDNPYYAKKVTWVNRLMGHKESEVS